MYLAGATPSVLRNIVTNPLALSYPSSNAARCTVAPRDIFWMARRTWSCRRHRPNVSPVSFTRRRFNVRSPTPTCFAHSFIVAPFAGSAVMASTRRRRRGSPGIGKQCFSTETVVSSWRRTLTSFALASSTKWLASASRRTFPAMGSSDESSSAARSAPPIQEAP